MVKHLFSCFFLTFFAIQMLCATPADRYKFKRVEVAKGLSNSEVKCIYKDKTGFLWFGTPSGLNRYDGYSVIPCKLNLGNDSTYPANNDIEKIQEATDGKLWIKTRSGYCVYNPSLEKFEENINPLFEAYSGPDGFRNTSDAVMYIDFGKNLWFVTPNDVRKYDVARNKYVIFPQGKPNGLSSGRIRDIKQGQNRYWFLFDSGTLECMEAQSHQIIHRDSFLHKAAGLKSVRNLKLFVDSWGDVWVYGAGRHYGLACYNIARNTWTHYASFLAPPYRISNNIVSAIEEDDKGIIWVGTDHGGVNLINKTTGEISLLWQNEQDPQGLPQNTIRSIYKDDANIIWLGTYKKGACYYHESIYKFRMITEKSPMPFKDVNCFHESADGHLWLGTNGGGLLYFDRTLGRYTTYMHNPERLNSPAGDVIVGLELDPQGRLWIGYYLAGMDCFDGKTFTHYTVSDPEGLTDSNAWVLRCDRSGNLWVGTLGGSLLVWDTRTGKRLKRFSAGGAVYSIIETKEGRMLIGSQNGLFLYNAYADKLEPYEREAFEDIQLAKNDINHLFEDSRGLLWIGTRNGLFVFNPYTKNIQLFLSGSGLSSDLVQSILEDSEHNMWVATNRGLNCIRVSTQNDRPGYFYNLLSYDSSEGLQGEMFNYNAAYFTSRSELIFGGSYGYNIFTPTGISFNTHIPRVVITDFQLFNKKIKPQEAYNGQVILTQSITHTKEINLNYADNYFSLSFAALDYCMPDKSRYYYKLEGFNNQWLETGQDNRKVTYTNLNPGSYTLYLKAINNDGVESGEPVVLRIHIHPPFWKTLWAWILYAVVALGGSVYAFYRIGKRSEEKLKDAEEKMRVGQQLEIDEMKLHFFTNISHEFRTPLTLILSPLEDLLHRTGNMEEKELLSIIRRNAQNLLTLVNQLLDFRKLETHAPSLQQSLGDIVLFIKQQVDLFAELMARKDITFSFQTEMTQLYTYFDAEKLSKALVNILSNAYKFTASEGNIQVELTRLSDETVRLCITDTGIGIPKDELNKIFDRFYQVKREGSNHYQGSGIGLHIAKEFVLLHGGKIWAERVAEGGTRFVILLPCKEEKAVEANPSPRPALENKKDRNEDESAFEAEFKRDQSPKLLIVEDNKELRDLLTSRLKNNYHILQAEDGEEGLKIALKEIPDMILSDVMMPRMDGIEMSKHLKGDIRTSHIPIILLTAKTGDESKLQGLTAGADDYISKPFNQEILQIKIRNLVEMRKRNQALFEEQMRIEPSKIVVNSLDKQLISKAIEYTENNLSNPNFSVEELSRELGMSRVHLYKKLSSLSGKTPIEFIRIIRLKRAAQLLKESRLTVSEIAYEVGFNNPKYFRKYFKDEFGVLPSQYALGKD
ncbi:MAG: response regulator [Tannerellaceae bacterium]|jgi:signal transduction histidine kinase/ligand-binding sensor domain-containing protein/DNA-binding response OmpR family regulator|nr:response regulator [Tannerellaceae bacterium]